MKNRVMLNIVQKVESKIEVELYWIRRLNSQISFRCFKMQSRVILLNFVQKIMPKFMFQNPWSCHVECC